MDWCIAHFIIALANIRFGTNRSGSRNINKYNRSRICDVIFMEIADPNNAARARCVELYSVVVKA